MVNFLVAQLALQLFHIGVAEWVDIDLLSLYQHSMMVAQRKGKSKQKLALDDDDGDELDDEDDEEEEGEEAFEEDEEEEETVAESSSYGEQEQSVTQQTINTTQKSISQQVSDVESTEARRAVQGARGGGGGGGGWAEGAGAGEQEKVCVAQLKAQRVDLRQRHKIVVCVILLFLILGDSEGTQQEVLR